MTSQSASRAFDFWKDIAQESTEAWSKATQGKPVNPFEFWQEFVQKSTEAARKTGLPAPGSDPYQLYRQFFSAWSDSWIKALAQSATPDVFEANQKLWMEQLEAMAQGFAKAMSSEAFSEMLGKTIEQGFTAQERAAKAADPQIDAALRALNLPSRGQVDRMFERIIGLEERLDDMEDRQREILAAIRASGVALGGAPNGSKSEPRAPRARPRQSRGKAGLEGASR